MIESVARAMISPEIARMASAQIDKAEALLTDHYHWQKSWRPALGSPKCSSACRESVSSRQWDSTADITRETADNIDMEAVDWCMNALSPTHRKVIGIEMRNREVSAKVWGNTPRSQYNEAMQAIIPLMRRKNLL